MISKESVIFGIPNLEMNVYINSSTKELIIEMYQEKDLDLFFYIIQVYRDNTDIMDILGRYSYKEVCRFGEGLVRGGA